MKNLLTFLLFTLTWLASPSIQALQKLDHIVAIVNDDVITYQALQQKTAEFKQQLLRKKGRVPSNEIMQKQVLERMITDSAQLQLAKSQGINIDDISLNKIINEIAENNKTTLSKMQKSLQKDGIDFDYFREQTRNDMIIRQLQQRMVFNRINVTSNEVEQFLEQQNQTGASEKYHLAHILVATPEAASPETIQAAFDKAEKIHAQLDAGESFTEVAQQHSQGRNALSGGDLGWRTAAELPALFLTAAKKLKKNGISPTLRSAGGFHILQLIDKKTQQHLVRQTHARHILVQTDTITSDDDAMKKLSDIKNRLDSGEDFAQLAKQYSQDPGSKDKGGDLGWAGEGNFVPRFEKVMNSLKVNQVSEPFKSSFGWHIIQVLGHRTQDETQQLKYKRAEKAIQARKAEEELQLWLRRVRDEAYVEYRNKPDA